MEVEHDTKVFRLDLSLQGNLEAMAAEGWMLVPGIVPVGVYHVVRLKGVQPGPQPLAAAAPVARLAIDETKIKILRDGKLIDN